MTGGIGCPSEQILARLLVGELAEAEAEDLAEHLEQCDRCVATVGSLKVDDTLIEAARAHRATRPDPDDGMVRTLIERLAELPFFTQPAEDGAADRQPTGDIDELLAALQGPGERRRLGPYRILNVLGVGGMGVVFQAEDPSLKRMVALKTLRPLLAGDAAARKRFLREAQAAAAVTHDHIVTIHQVGEDGGIPFLAMQLLQGETLEQRLQRLEAVGGLLEISEILRIGCQTCQGLAVAHAQGLIHRDIKPANLWLESDGGRVKILDFGLARAADDETCLTDPGTIAGTPAYLAPEMLSGKPVDQRSDLFSLGCVFYRMLTGRAPISGQDKISTWMAVASRTPEQPAEVNPAVPAALSQLVMQLLAKAPSDRPASASAVLEALQSLSGNQTSTVKRTPHVRPAFPARAGKRRTIAGVAGLVVVLIAAAALVWVKTDRGEFILDIAGSDVAFELNKQGGLTLRDQKTKRSYTLNVGRHHLPSGDYELDVVDSAGMEFSTKQFTLRRGGEVKVIASLRGTGDPKYAAIDAWAKGIVTLPLEKQVEAVSAKLKELNPEFDGVVGPRFENGVVAEVQLLTDKVTDITPLRALTGLEMLVCRGSGPGKGHLTDLSPLRGMKLTYLDCGSNFKLTDLSPLKGMPLRKLIAWCTGVADLRPLSGMPLTWLDVQWAYVADLEALEGMSLARIWLRSNVAAPDLSPLSGMPLKEIECEFNPERDTRVLRSIRTLEKINEKPVREFWREATARRAAFDKYLKRVPTLPPQEQVAAVAAKLKEYNPQFDAQVFPQFAENQVVQLSLFTNNIRDLRPLRALRKLERLYCMAARPGRSTLFDLSPLADLPLKLLDCSRTNVSDLAPLKKTPLQAVMCSQTLVRDLSPLGGLRLIWIDCSGTSVSDLTPLRGMGLLHVHLTGTNVSDLSPLQGMPIDEISFDFKRERDAEFLRSMKTVRKINNKPAAEFLKDFDGAKDRK